jgi:hypothetical protein
MAADPLTAVLNIGGQLIDRLWPDQEKKDQAKLAVNSPSCPCVVRL